MNRLRCFLFAATVVISSATFAVGGDMQTPGKSEPPPPPPPTVLTTSTSDLTQPTSTEEIQFVWQDATTMFVEILLTVF